MITYKCKHCGAILEITEGSTVATCDYCGTKQTLPRLDDERRRGMYDRANHFRRISEFDKAMGIFEQILQEDRTDAEAYWSLVLCRYGVTYVKDPRTEKQIPTMNRLRIESVLSDEDYKSALEHADPVQRELYEAEAKRLAEIQRGYLEVFWKEKQFDLFICYKETDESGRRTMDSQIAQQIYYALKDEGYNVFFSRITLEDKIGQEYEPYIFAALQSARVMLLVGTKKEYLESPWVKNEWSRFLALMRNDRTKHLFPCYRDMDPYDLPDEVSMLQAQDMSLIGAIQDLIRNLKKVLPRDNARSESNNRRAAAPNEESLTNRAFQFLKNGSFDDARSFLKAAIDENAEYPPIYLGRILCKYHLRQEEELDQCLSEYEKDTDWQKLIRLSTPERKSVLLTHVNSAQEVRAKKQREELYRKACADLAVTDSEADCLRIKKIFESFHGYKESVRKTRECDEKLEWFRRERIYRKAEVLLGSANTYQEFDQAIELLSSIRGHRDADRLIGTCNQRKYALFLNEYSKATELLGTSIATVDPDGCKAAEGIFLRLAQVDFKDSAKQAKAATEARERILEELRKRKEQALKEEERARKAKARRKRRPFVLLLILILITGGIYFTFQVVIPGLHYLRADVFLMEKKYKEAAEEFELVGDRWNAHDQVMNAQYRRAEKLLKNGDASSAYDIYIALKGYRDVDTLLTGNQELLLASYEVGRQVLFGSYEQDGNDYDGKEPIEWLVIAKEANERTLVCMNLLEASPFHEKSTSVTWEISSIREWLNSDFYEQAFTSEERKRIVKKTVTAQANPKYKSYQGRSTADHVWMLSINEAQSYLVGSGKMTSPLSIHARSQGAYEEKNHCGCWWLRNSGNAQSSAAYVDSAGKITTYGRDVSWAECCIRPVIVVKVIDGSPAVPADSEYAATGSVSGNKEDTKDTDHSDTDSKPDAIELLSSLLGKRSDTKAGNIRFGHYEQDNNMDNGPEEIEWIVLAEQEGSKLLISKHVLDFARFHTTQTNITWDKSSVRKWLNERFLVDAFDEKELKRIRPVRIVTNVNPVYSTKQSVPSDDLVHLLSIDEYKEYLDDTEERKAIPTAYAKSKGAYISYSTGLGQWWLCTPGLDLKHAIVALGNGEISYRGLNIDVDRVGIRPVILITSEDK